MFFFTHFPFFFSFSFTGPIYFLLSSDPLCPQMPTSRGEHLGIVETTYRSHVESRWLFQKSKTNGGKLTQAEIAKLHFMFLKYLKIFSFFRVNPLKKSIFLLFAFWVHFLWLLLPFNAFTRTADCISYCHLQENTNVLFSRFLDILKWLWNDQWLHILCGTKLYLSILNPVLMLEHALTEYYVSICFVNLLYSNCLLPEVNDEIKSVHIHLLKIKLDTF